MYVLYVYVSYIELLLCRAHSGILCRALAILLAFSLSCLLHCCGVATALPALMSLMPRPGCCVALLGLLQYCSGVFFCFGALT